MTTPLLPDALWNLIQPLLPSPLRKPKGGRPRLPDRACLTGVLFVLRSGIPWEMLPQENRVERSSSRAGLSSRCGPVPFTAHCNDMVKPGIGVSLATPPELRLSW
jgi:transposase